ncbi:DUF2829 domain-containing protein [Pediococcus argentinicus]|uniref:Thoeris anti-defense 2-like domain-containing protein n=1 Tax=Pediococcus argentinicus TaxID=480391 RepID=A0A0R2NHE7_9LACO|nr:DUF2829 domain-containing protein [Pediococcus argentinicus]KRO25233.1 hypothetical protein IV88_GL000362 [Pediococcus argentinicus]NKZ22370.1 DUF2829 domain-containing protein [Pediococcus argentinicus]GEP19493.1 hypothetical protein LSA03_08770 [Pediococcus argentinicus]
MTFEKALPLIKSGSKMVRTNWEGTELYIQMIPKTTFEGQPLNPYFVIKTADEAFSMWTPTDCDVLAEDWAVVDD